MTDSTLIMIAACAAALLVGALTAWLAAKQSAQSQQFALNCRLAELNQQYQAMLNQYTQAQEALDDSRRHAADLQADLQDIHSRFAAACQQIEYLQEQHAATGRLKTEYDALQQHAHELSLHNEHLQTLITQERRAADEKLALLTEARQSFGQEFHYLAQTVLEEKSRRFNEQSHEQLGRLLTPLNERLHGFGELVQQTYEKETKERLTLENELKRLQTLNNRLHNDAQALTAALTGTQNKTQGTWGEMILETVLQQSGLRRGLEYQVQTSATRIEEDGSRRRLQPDVVINLPDNKKIIIDAKVSLTAYVRYTQAADSDTARQALNAHTASIRNHIKTLSEKDYTDLGGIDTLDFVFMFVPVEPAYLAALQHDDKLLQEGFDKRIMLVGPGTLLAALRTVAHLWRSEQQNQNAAAIAEEGGRLYDKFVGFVHTLETVGKSLQQAEHQFQTAYRQLTEGRGNLIARTDKLRQLGAKTTKQLDPQLLDGANVQEEEQD
ncbi:DNA recombination protein RmuC [Neisseria sp. ZJ106]|uniref:DNA recombination protein RmuC n=1 Tax=Neisseria lisongii TaxID=2912188 RepID=A0ABY7RK10_9NEIS|nr:DNA recombination protein RmuC [Neisseria lisongii]MCF7521918.1 DNA recombination protein RmuC [Neisseria lisongii]WCL71121.1 DNA recombination protein RmuC [Neisseria lisongii]